MERWESVSTAAFASADAGAESVAVEMHAAPAHAGATHAAAAYAAALQRGRRWQERDWPRLEARPAANATSAAVSEVATTTAAVSEVAWGLVAHHIAAPALCALGAACRRTYVATRGVVPGLRPSLALFAHQRNGLCYMLRKERGGRLGRGGLLCDEPGMGKTLTLLAVLLRTARLRARPEAAEERGRRRSACRAAGEVECVDGGGTLIVSPVAVLDHWKAEILRHVAGPASGVGAVLDHPVLGRVAFDTPLESTGRLAASLPSWRPGRAPDVLLTSEQRLSSEFRAVRDSRFSKRTSDGVYASPLLATAWLRCVVDEGQHAGSGAATNLHLMLAKIRIERRWIMTGTPTTAASGELALRQHGRLLRAAGEGPWAFQPTDADWRRAVVDPLVRGPDPAAAAALAATCASAMVRHATADLRLPAPLRTTTRLDASDAEARSLNAYVSFVKANLLLTSMHVDDRENMSDGDAVSLLHAGNRKQAREALENILLCCAGGGEMVKQPHAGVLEELRRLLRKVPGADAAKVDDACAFFATARSERACAVCGIRLSYLLVAPCCCVLCPECVGARDVGCGACGEPFPAVDYFESDDADKHEVEVSWSPAERKYVATCHHWHGWLKGGENVRCTKRHERWTRKTRSPQEFFAWLQPGVELKWHDALLEGASADRAAAYHRRKRSRGAAAVVADGAPEDDAAAVDSLAAHSKASHVARVLEAAAAARRARRGGDDSRPVRAILFAESRQILDLVGHSLVHCFGPDAVCQHWGKYRSDELRKFADGEISCWTCPACGFSNEDRGRQCSHRKLSLEDDEGGLRDVWEEQVRGHFLGRVYAPGEAVAVRGETFVVANVGRCGRARKRGAKDAVRRLPEGDVRVLLLHHDGRHGLNLPFATHIFLLSTLWDPAYELQVVSRARRIGATGPVRVDQLLIRGTAEDALHELARRRGAAIDDAGVADILRGLRLLRTAPGVSDASPLRPTHALLGPARVSDASLPRPTHGRRVSFNV